MRSTRLLEEWDELEAASRVVLAVWGESAKTLASPQLLRTYAHFGNPVIGAFDADESVLCGVSIGFLAVSGGVHLHSHITGVAPSHQHLGVGFGLKVAQRRWCLDHGLDDVTWTFDPLIARNAHFNMRKLGALSAALLPGFYGAMGDDLNRDDDTDRLEVHWPISSDRVVQALRGDGVQPGNVVRTIAVPEDYHGLRREDPSAARRWRASVREQLVAAFDDGLEIVDFSRDEGYRLAMPGG